MKELCYFATLVIVDQCTWHNFVEDLDFHFHHCWNIGSYKITVLGFILIFLSHLQLVLSKSKLTKKFSLKTECAFFVSSPDCMLSQSKIKWLFSGITFALHYNNLI